MRRLYQAATLALIAGTALPLLRSDAWWIRVLDFPRVHLAAAGAILLSRWRPGRERPLDDVLYTALAGAVLYQASRIWPYTPLSPREVQTASPDSGEAGISLLVANVRMTNRSAGGLMASIRRHRPDVVLLLEPDRWWAQRVRALQRQYPHRVEQIQSNTYGMLLYSRVPLIDPRVEFLVQSDVPSIHARIELQPGRICELHALHPHPPSPMGRDTTTARDAELLIVGKRIRGGSVPALVAGDLNDVAWSRTTTLFQRISRLLDPRKGRGLYNSFHAGIPLFRFPVDHVFHSRDFTLARLARLPAFGSDHFPILVSLRLTPARADAQEAPDRTPHAQEMARRKITKAQSLPGRASGANR